MTSPEKIPESENNKDIPFEIESFESAGQHYKDSLLKLVNGSLNVRTINPQDYLDGETRTEKILKINSDIEWKECELIRKDICEAFGVPNDEEHVIEFPIEKTENNEEAMQRAVRAFIILVDKKTGKRMYGEGRVFHIEMFRELIGRLFAMRKEEKDVGTDGIFYKTITSSDFIYFKGLLDAHDFKDLTEKASRTLRTPIYDKEGNKIETPKNWFITGHNIPEFDF